MTFLELQPLTTEQLPAVVDLDRLCFGGLWTMEGYQRELVSPNSDLLVLNLNHPKSLVGLGCYWAILEEAHITLLAIHPDYRRQGLGLLLLTALLRLAHRRGLERATLEVRASNHEALSLYQKLGFQEAGRRRRYYKDSGEDALILWCGGVQKPEFAAALAKWRQSVGDRLATKGWQLLEVGRVNSI